MRPRPFLPALVLLMLVLLPAAGAAQEPLEPVLWDALDFRHVGPIGNRVSAVAGVPGERGTYFAGAASGGIWKTTDGGLNWQPVFDDQPVQSIGALAVAASDPNVVWAGTGEPFIRSNVVVGNGVYRSLDGGDSWEHMGLPESGRIGRILIHPDDPDTVWVAALGHLYGPQQQRGVFRTRDGGRSWTRVLFVNENTGAVDLAMDPERPRLLYAAMWEMRIWTWGRQSGGPGSGIHRSDDGGDTWTQLTEGGYPAGRARPDDHAGRGTVRSADGIVARGDGGAGRGLPGGVLGKIGLALSPDDPSRVYALIETSAFPEFAPADDVGVLWRSENRGDSWRLISRDHTLTQRPLYYTRAAVAPDDANEIHFLSVAHTRSLDGGASIEFLGGGGDNHDMWIDPVLPDRMIIGHDGGVSISENRGESWFRPPLPIAQMYHVATDDRVPYRLYGNRQDGPSYGGPSNSLTRGGIPSTAWHSVGGCESGWALPDPSDPDIVWSGCYDSILDRYDHRSGHARNVSVWPDNPEGWAAGDLDLRFQWTFPVAISPHDSAVVYAGSQHVHRTRDGGQSWETISPDLTTDDIELQRKTGGLTPDDSSPTYAAVLFAIAESPLAQGTLWAGSNDGLLHVSRDGGESWENVTGQMTGLPPLGTVSSIEPSRHHPDTVYVAIDMHQVGSTEPQLWRTRDGGGSWSRIVDGIPSGPLSYTHVLREDPVRPGLLYAGTGNALYVSFDDGNSWLPLQNDLPHAPVHWITVQEHFNDLVVATYGRGFWILDDIAPLQQLDESVLAEDVWLFEPRPTYRFRYRESPVTLAHDGAAGENPQYGAALSYWLSEPVPGGVRIEITDADGEGVRTLSGPGARGINRVWWDLRFEPSPTPKLRTQPRDHPHAEFNEQGWRPLVEGGRVTPLAPPGDYGVRLISGEHARDQILTLRKDPASEGSLGDIEAQHALVMEIREALGEVVGMIDEVEWLRRQLLDLDARLTQQDAPQAAEVGAAARELEERLGDFEMNLFDLRLTGGTAFQDSLRWPRQLYAKLASLAGYVSGTDHRPTDQHLEVFASYRQRLASLREELAALRAEVAGFNETARAAGLELIDATR